MSVPIDWSPRSVLGRSNSNLGVKFLSFPRRPANFKAQIRKDSLGWGDWDLRALSPRTPEPFQGSLRFHSLSLKTEPPSTA